MGKNLLLGNGINQCSDMKLFSTSLIKDRFCKSILNIDEAKYEELRRYLIDSVSVICNKEDLNIEQLASEVYDHIKTKIENEVGYFSGNCDQRIKRILKEIALKAIFVIEGKFIEIEICSEIKDIIEKYDSIFSLNYYEYWDKLKITKHLHGNIKKSPEGNTISDYEECIFTPLLNIPKSKSEALYPSNHLDPAKDLYPMGDFVLYEELNGLNEIDIFGVSPYGDDELFAKLQEIREKTIFIYKMNDKKDDLSEWKKVIGPANYVDSSCFR